MIQIIDGRRYNTDTAELIATTRRGRHGDVRFHTEYLFRTPLGAWFTYAHGCLASHYVELDGEVCTVEDDFRALTETEALAWLEAAGVVDLIERYFSERITDA